MKKSVKALFSRGLDLATAERVVNDGWTLAKIKQEDEKELKAIGLGKDFIDLILKEPRPPIPDKTLASILFANRFQCCVCRNPQLSIIVHHIEEWSVSRSHDIQNLAVLCLHHHDEAHSHKTLSQNLEKGTLQQFKKRWEQRVKELDASAVLEAMRLDYSTWNFINELRVFELAETLGVNTKTGRFYLSAFAAGQAGKNGMPTSVINEKLFYKYEGPEILSRYFYVSDVLARVISKLSIINISDYLERGVLQSALAAGDMIFVQGSHTFSPTTGKKSGRGRGQIVEGIRRANHVEVRFVFDRWEATSSSAKSCRLTGTRNQGSLVQIKDIARDKEKLIIRGTVLGICSNLGDLKKRDYAPNL